MTSTLDILNSFADDPAEEQHSQFGVALEEPIVSQLLDHPEFCRSECLKPEYFSKLTCRFVVAVALN